MAKSKKQKAHALRKELIKASLEREQEWKPETIKEDLAAFSDRYLKKAGKSNPRATHLTNIFRAFPEIKFSIENDKIYLEVSTFEGAAKIQITEEGVQLIFDTHDPEMDTEDIINLNQAGILWRFSRGKQYFTPKNKKDPAEDFKLLYEYTKEVGKLV
jgi:hypothetical protein